MRRWRRGGSSDPRARACPRRQPPNLVSCPLITYQTPLTVRETLVCASLAMLGQHFVNFAISQTRGLPPCHHYTSPSHTARRPRCNSLGTSLASLHTSLREKPHRLPLALLLCTPESCRQAGPPVFCNFAKRAGDHLVWRGQHRCATDFAMANRAPAARKPRSPETLPDHRNHRGQQSAGITRRRAKNTPRRR